MITPKFGRGFSDGAREVFWTYASGVLTLVFLPLIRGKEFYSIHVKYDMFTYGIALLVMIGVSILLVVIPESKWGGREYTAGYIIGILFTTIFIPGLLYSFMRTMEFITFGIIAGILVSFWRLVERKNKV